MVEDILRVHSRGQVVGAVVDAGVVPVQPRLEARGGGETEVGVVQLLVVLDRGLFQHQHLPSGGHWVAAGAELVADMDHCVDRVCAGGSAGEYVVENRCVLPYLFPRSC